MKRVAVLFFAFSLLSLPLLAQNEGSNGRLLSASQLRDKNWFYDLESALADPDKVYKLSLSDQQLKALPPEIGKLKNLQVLNLSNCGLKALPIEIKNLKHLQMLSLYGNKLKFIPPEFRELSKLEVLYLGRNRLTFLPVWVGGMGRLRRLDISRNRITPDEVIAIRNMMPRVDLTY
ncbi:MAG: leucine-rich repeat domain-containing protein [Bacteroidota bacterium]